MDPAIIDWKKSQERREEQRPQLEIPVYEPEPQEEESPEESRGVITIQIW